MVGACLIRVVVAVEDESPQRLAAPVRRGRYPLDDRLQDLLDADALQSCNSPCTNNTGRDTMLPGCAELLVTLQPLKEGGLAAGCRPRTILAEQARASLQSRPMTSSISRFTRSTSAPGRSILLST